MKEIILTCCGAVVPAPPTETDCGCGTHLSEGQVESMQQKELTHIPVVDEHRAAAMLNQSSSWIRERRQLLEPIYGGAGLDFVFPLTAIQRFAKGEKLMVTPRPLDRGVLWVPKHQQLL